MAGKDLIRYDLLVQEALKGVVRKVLIDCKDGLPGEHHFYISFQTDFPGVRLSNRLREKYPQEMTIVLQHQFWDMNVTEHTFEVGLSFSGVPERLLIPFDALTGFFDPSVQFGLKFDGQEEDEGDDIIEAPPAPQPIRGGSEPVELKQPRKAAPEKKPAPENAPAPAAEMSDMEMSDDSDEDAEDTGTPGTAEVVSLDAFRKKN
ncbi:SspB family protein [Microvirga sp. 2YAF29]|uniref:SspB family protein n=1 Tax=Microvirga sp. 2YAF29 TaxID=3233031 RepID=UPI003F9E1359